MRFSHFLISPLNQAIFQQDEIDVEFSCGRDVLIEWSLDHGFEMIVIDKNDVTSGNYSFEIGFNM